MPAGTQRSTPSVRRPDVTAALRQALDAAAFSHEQVKAALRSDDALNIPRERAPLLLQELGSNRLATLIALFVAGAPVPTVFATPALAPLTLQQAEALGIVGLGRSLVHPAVRLWPTPEGVFASDLEEVEAADYVMGVSASTRLLARTTIRRPIETALDLGTGNGYLAILAARHAQRAIASDINPRAAAFAAFNAALNAVDNVEVRQGDMFEPVEGETFDLIVSNPPFVISPENAYIYRDSGLGGDQVSRTLVERLPRYLKPGGLAQVTINWVHQPGDDWDAPLRQWVAGNGCDAWFIREASYDPQTYAMMWNQRLLVDPANKQRYADTLERWTRHFQQAGIRAVGSGLAILRRREGVNRVRVEDMPRTPSTAPGGPLAWLQTDIGPDLDRLLAADDQLEALTDTALLERPLAPAEGVHLDQVLRWQAGAFRMMEARLTSELGLRPVAQLDPASTLLLRHIDGEQTVRAVLDATGKALGREDLDLLAFRENMLPAIRGLVAHGLLSLR